MSKKQRLKELCEQIKTTYNLDVVTAISTKSKFLKEGFTYNPNVVLFKMRYELTGRDVVQFCPISWAAIGVDEDDFIVRTCGGILASHPDVKRTLSNMASNAVMRAERIGRQVGIAGEDLKPGDLITQNEYNEFVKAVSEEPKASDEPKPKSK